MSFLPSASSALLGGSIGSSLINTAFQFQNLKYQKKLQKKIFEREDTAIQRRVADLEAAGLSPVLAAGQGADAGPAISTHAPQNETVKTVMEILTMQENIAQSRTQQALNAGILATQKAEQRYKSALADYAEHEADYYRKSGTVKGSSNYAKMMSDAIQLMEALGKINKPSPINIKATEAGAGFGKWLKDKLNPGEKK